LPFGNIFLIHSAHLKEYNGYAILAFNFANILLFTALYVDDCFSNTLGLASACLQVVCTSPTVS